MHPYAESIALLAHLALAEVATKLETTHAGLDPVDTCFIS